LVNLIGDVESSSLMRHIAKLSSLGLRGATLTIRFCLSFYILKFLGYEAFGVYGLVLGLIGVIPAAIGWGLNYFVSREVVGRPQTEALLIVRDRLVITVLSLTTLTVLALILLPVAGYPLGLTSVLVIMLIWTETLGLDINQPLIGVNLALPANIVYFIRSALWVVPLVAAGILWPATRTLDVIFGVWLVGQLFGLGSVLWFVRKWPLGLATSMPIDRKWVHHRLSTSWFIYLSDLGLVGLIYVDRYIVGAMLGLALTGVYTFFWSLTNALQTLVQTAVVQLALPPLVIAVKEGGTSVWRATLRTEFIRTLVISVVLSVAIYLASEVIIEVLGMQSLREHRLVFILLLLAAVLRSCSDLLNAGLTSLTLDRYYAIINIGGILLSVVLASAGIALFGLNGAGFAAVITAGLLTAVRVALLLHGTAGWVTSSKAERA
jgi:O-antigen/teichoic acid export membrane protein